MKLKQPFQMLGAAGAAGVVGAFAFAGPAMAEVVTIDINDGNVPTTAGEYEDQSCDQVPGGPLVGQDGWVFVLPAASGADGNFISVEATYEDGAGDTHVYTTEANGGIVDGQGDNKAYIITPDGWTLVDATAEVNDPNEGAFFNLTHACPASGPGDDESPTPDETSPVPSEDVTTPGEDGETTTPGEESTSPASDTLPTTGAPLTIALVSAGALAAAGSALFIMMRRRRAAENW